MKRITVLVLCVLLQGAALGVRAAPPMDRGDALDVKRAKVTIESVLFVTELSGINARFKETQPDNYRGMVLTAKIAKPAGEPLTLYAQDVVLHYNYGSKNDVARCTGLSTFSLTNDADRPMQFSSSGLVSATTGVNTLKATEIYVDLFFQNMESDTSQVELYVAQPIGARYIAKGWKK